MAKAKDLQERRRKRRIQRAKVRTLTCPTCGATPGNLCLRDGSPSPSNHAARHKLALDTKLIVKRDWWE